MNLPFVLDVAIGLIFTYLILSLLASELQELVATVLQWRAKHLKDSIEVLLAGGVNTPEEQQVKDLVQRLYSDPLLKNVNQEAKGGIARFFRQVSSILFPGNRQGAFGQYQATGPSYIAPETFATSLIEQLGLNSMIDQLTKMRFQKFVERIVGQYRVNEFGDIEIPSDELVGDDWARGNIRVIAAKAYRTNLNEAPNFKELVEDYHSILTAFKTQQASLETSIERLGEDLDQYIESFLTPEMLDRDTESFVRRLRAYKVSVFGENNDRAILSGGLKPTLSEVAELANQGSAAYQEVAQAYDQIANQARPIDAQVNASIQAQIDDYVATLSPNAEQPRRFEELDYDLQQSFLAMALKDLTEEERKLYESYQTYKQIRSVLTHLPDSVKNSLLILGRRAQTRVHQTENEINQFRHEIAVWFDRSMSRASGVYKRNAKGVAILLGLCLAAATNSDTFHIFNRLSSDDNLRQLVTNRAAELNLSAQNNPRLSAQLEELKNETDAVLREISFPITWNPVNLSRQLGCSSDLPLVVRTTNQAEANQLRQPWDNLYRACLNTQQAATNTPIPLQVAQIALNRPLGFLRMVSGWIVSGIAIAMGAPFWFDLLGKVVNVRNSGGKPRPAAGEEQKTN
jgi:hypothetical protein